MINNILRRVFNSLIDIFANELINSLFESLFDINY